MVKRTYLVLILCLSLSQVHSENKIDEEESNKNVPVAYILPIKANSNSVKKELKVDTNTTIIKSTIKPNENRLETNKVSDNDLSQIESGAVIRGVLVVVGISMVFIIYLGYKTYWKKKANVIVRKYGVKTRRCDVEMTPLPLDDDEEDETAVFDLGNLSKS